MAGLGYLAGPVIQVPGLIMHYFPLGVFGVLTAVALLINPVLHLAHPRLKLRGGELATVAALMLIGCSIPGSGLMRFWSVIQVVPLETAETQPMWQKNHLLNYVPPELLLNGGQYDEAVVHGLYVGGKREGRDLPLSEVPWGAWRVSAGTWGLLALLTAGAVLSLSLILHRQWSRNERLQYPIAAAGRTLLEQDPASPWGPIYRRRLFWIGLGIVLTIRVVNGIHLWYPEFIEIPLRFEIRPIMKLFPYAQKVVSNHWWVLLLPTIYPTIVAFAYFVPSDVSFSMGISLAAFVWVCSLLVGTGMDFSQQFIEGGPLGWQYFGSYLGLAIIIAYTGRRYYWSVFRHAVGFPRSITARDHADSDPAAAWAMRVLLVCLTALTAEFIWLGLQWPLAILAVGLLMMLYVVVARMTAENGMVWIYAGWMPTAVLIGLFGRNVAGPGAIIITGMLVSMLAVDPREALMPFAVNGLKLAEGFRIKPGRVMLLGGLVFAVGLAVAVPTVIWCNHNEGIIRSKWTREVATRPFDAAGKVATTLRDERRLEQVDSMSSWQRLAHMRPEAGFLKAAGIGLGLVLLFSALRLRLPWWPIHPVLFLVWGQWPSAHFSFSFLLGFLIKQGVVRFGASGWYRRGKDFMFGVVAGDLLGGMIFMIVAFVYYQVTGKVPLQYGIFM